MPCGYECVFPICLLGPWGRDHVLIVLHSLQHLSQGFEQERAGTVYVL